MRGNVARDWERPKFLENWITQRLGPMEGAAILHPLGCCRVHLSVFADQWFLLLCPCILWITVLALFTERVGVLHFCVEFFAVRMRKLDILVEACFTDLVNSSFGERFSRILLLCDHVFGDGGHLGFYVFQ